MAIAGIILSAISIVVCMVFWGVMVSEFGRAYMDIYENVYDDIMDDYYSREWNFDTDEWEDWQRDDRSGREFNSYELPEQEENGMLPLSADLPLDELTIGKF